VLSASRTYQPRAWVLAHMTDAICSAQLFRLIENEAEKAKGRR